MVFNVLSQKTLWRLPTHSATEFRDLPTAMVSHHWPDYK